MRMKSGLGDATRLAMFGRLHRHAQESLHVDPWD
jgi:hypothetical protein